jgi:hypothetical protein
MEEIDIWRAAAEMIRQFGEDAAVTAGMRADALLEQGDGAGFRVWVRVVTAINELERKPSASEPRN